MEVMMVEDRTTYGVFVSGVAGPLDEFLERLVDEGMSERVAAEVIRSMPCFVKRDVPLAIAKKYKSVFERAGAWVMLENWQTTTNPAAHQGFIDRPTGEAPLEFAIAVGTAAGARVSGRDELVLDWAERDDGDPPAAAAAAAAPPAPVLESSRIALPPRESAVSRWTPTAIAVGLLLVLCSYVYGCARVTQKQGRLNDQLADLNRVLENYNARGSQVTEAMIIDEVRTLADRAGVSVDADEVVVSADPIIVERHPYGGCVVEHWPDSVRFLSHFSYQRLMSLRESCAIPRWIIGVKVNTTVRWGLASQRLEFEHYTPVLRYDDVY